MDEVIVIQPSTITAIGDAIIDTTGITEPFNFGDVPRLIREDVYNKGYADGEANGTGGGSSSPVLYGTYLLRDNPTYPLPDEYVRIEFGDGEAYTHFTDVGANQSTYNGISGIEFGDDGLVYIYSRSYDAFTFWDSVEWLSYFNGGSGLPHPSFRIIDIKTPIAVTQDLYDIFMCIVDNSQQETPFDIGVDEGKKAEYNEFWDNFQNKGSRTYYGDAFRGTGYEYIRPKFKIIPTEVMSGCRTFRACPYLKKIESQYFDFSQLPAGTYEGAGMYYTFAGCSVLEEIEDIGLSPSYSYSYTFAYNGKLKTIAKITVDANTRFSGAFENCIALENLIIEGTIGQNGLNLRWSTKLSNASITNIMTQLSTTTEGLSITLSKEAVDNAFRNGNTPGSESPDWKDLVLSRSKWTINLVQGG